MASDIVCAETWLRSTSIPTRFISLTTVRPKSERPDGAVPLTSEVDAVALKRGILGVSVKCVKCDLRVGNCVNSASVAGQQIYTPE